MNESAEVTFDKYVQMGAYHWREIGRHLLWHNAFTAERYRRVLDAAAPMKDKTVLDYGCGDGALLGWAVRSVGDDGRAVGFEPVSEARAIASAMLTKHRLRATVVASTKELENESFDRVLCSEVIEHVHEPDELLKELDRLLKPGGLAVLTTPVRLTEYPEEPTHVQEWFPGEFADLLDASPMKVLRHEQIIPASAPEVFFWRPPFFLRVPVFRILCNILSIYGKTNALTWLRMRPRLHMTQLAVLQKR